MYTYYSLDILPIILNRFKVHDIVISGTDDVDIIEHILEYCDNNNDSYVAIDSKDTFEKEFIRDYTLNVLPNLSDYDAIFINDDPNWYTVYNELNIIKEKNQEFPLVFVCHNIFPHKRRDSYINPEIIPMEFRKNYSAKLKYGNIFIKDNFYHANEENTSKNGVLTAIEDFLAKNPQIGIMDVKLSNGITILYPKNNISKIRLGLLSEEISDFVLEFDQFSDNIVENHLLSQYVSELNFIVGDFDSIENIKFEFDVKEKKIKEYEDKIRIHDNEISYKNSQIENVDSKLHLKDSQIKNIESKLINREKEIHELNIKVQEANNQINSLKDVFNQKIQNFTNKETEFNTKLDEAEAKITSLKTNIAMQEQVEVNLNNKLDMANNQIKENNEQLSIKDRNISDMNNQINLKQKELENKEKCLDFMKRRCTSQSSKLDSKEYCISCYKEEIRNYKSEIEYLNKYNSIRKLFTPLAYIFLIFKSNPKELSLNLKLYKSIKNSRCFDIGFYLANNEDLLKSKWCKYFSPELHYVCNGFDEKRKFNKKYFNRNSKEELLEYILNCQ